MKLAALISVLVSVVFWATAYAGSPPPKAAPGAQAEFEGKVIAAQGQLSSLHGHIEQIKTQASNLAADSRLGLELFKDYDLLLLARYVDEDGEFQTASEILTRDRENLNFLCKSFLRAAPLKGRISAHQARKMVAWSLDRLKDQLSAQESPSEKNNPELEIAKKQIQDQEDEIERVTKLASTQGIEIDPDSLAKRRPAAK